MVSSFVRYDKTYVGLVVDEDSRLKHIYDVYVQVLSEAQAEAHSPSEISTHGGLPRREHTRNMNLFDFEEQAHMCGEKGAHCLFSSLSPQDKTVVVVGGSKRGATVSLAKKQSFTPQLCGKFRSYCFPPLSGWVWRDDFSPPPVHERKLQLAITSGVDCGDGHVIRSSPSSSPVTR